MSKIVDNALPEVNEEYKKKWQEAVELLKTDEDKAIEVARQLAKDIPKGCQPPVEVMEFREVLVRKGIATSQDTKEKGA